MQVAACRNLAWVDSEMKLLEYGMDFWAKITVLNMIFIGTGCLSVLGLP
jgi:hypothetical protein